MAMTADQIKKSSLGKWESMTVELRPGNSKKFEALLFVEGFFIIS